MPFINAPLEVARNEDQDIKKCNYEFNYLVDFFFLKFNWQFSLGISKPMERKKFKKSPLFVNAFKTSFCNSWLWELRGRLTAKVVRLNVLKSLHHFSACFSTIPQAWHKFFWLMEKMSALLKFCHVGDYANCLPEVWQWHLPSESHKIVL